MPYPNEHAARLVDPKKFVKFRRQNDKFGPGVHAIFGIDESGKSELQTIRFDATQFSIEEVRRWLKEHNFKPLAIEKAKKTKEELSVPSETGAGKTNEGRQEGSRRLLEYCASGRQMRVDRDQSIIRGVKILGLESRNGRIYSAQALTEAIKLYEGKAVNVDHADGPRRSYRDRIGKLQNIELRPDGLYGNLTINPKHPLAEQLFWDAEHCPENVGLSHDAQGRTVIRSGKVIVEAIEAVRSVDLVAEPATTRSLYEDVDPDAVMPIISPEDGNADDEPDDNHGESRREVDKLADEAFALVLPGGVKIGNKTYPLHKRYFPIDTPERVKRALLAIAANRKLSQSHRELAMQRARDAARKFGLNPNEILNQKESVMDLSKLTLEELKEARPDLIEQLAGSLESDKQLLALKEDRDRLAAELAALRRKEQLAEELAQAKIPAERVPASLMESLLTVEQKEKRQAIITDLAKLLSASEKPISQRPGERLPETFEERVALWA